ncbi:CAF17-like 4Fe-4S cluster assembly/insertion protein YgfZ [Flexibacterium corallicola]|uniref:CAF17-like 4Fe-4S cluster assembly/insertion protein YgfZ n=1 Tax=Flexibacterium corallicola TaxID=3037259 RepID=UPI00286F7FBA|nr:folate-binding protein [Pseudovibrio sp. M1P-2-3]
MSFKFAQLSERGVLKVEGPDARVFLQNIITSDLDTLEVGKSAYSALLTPQGKVLWDFFIYAEEEDSFLLELPIGELPEFQKRLVFYRLRAKVEILDISNEKTVIVGWGESLPDGYQLDPRLPALGIRFLASSQKPEEIFSKTLPKSQEQWNEHRIALGVPESGLDFSLGDVFPHDVDMDCLNGISFQKGCFIGQEVVSRMKHRGTARKRIIQVKAPDTLPETDTPIEIDGKPAGTLSSSFGKTGLAMLRLDRVKTGIDAGHTLTAAGITLEPQIPQWANFDWP